MLLQGKWVIERIPGTGGSPKQASHVLKYAVELAVRSKPSRFIDLMEPLIQRSIAEDLPDSLDAIRNAAENLQGQVHPCCTAHYWCDVYSELCFIRTRLIRTNQANTIKTPCLIWTALNRFEFLRSYRSLLTTVHCRIYLSVPQPAMCIHGSEG